jgi:hypothetical protein
MPSGQQDDAKITTPVSGQEAGTGGKAPAFISHNRDAEDDAASGAYKNFFISYNKADRNWAEWIAWELEEAGYSTIIQEWHFKAGTNPMLNIQRGIEESERVIAVLSPDYLISRFTEFEWTAAIAKGSLLPIRVRECELKGLWLVVVYIDLVGLDEASARKALLDGVRLGVNPKTPPAFPGMERRPTNQPPQFPGNEITGGRRENKLFAKLAFVGLAAVVALLASVLINNHNQRLPLIDNNHPQPNRQDNDNSPPQNTNTRNNNSQNTTTRNFNGRSPQREIQTKASAPTPVRAGVMKWYKERMENIVDAEAAGKLECKDQECTQMVLVTRQDSGGVRQKTPERFRWKGNKWQPDLPR